MNLNNKFEEKIKKVYSLAEEIYSTLVLINLYCKTNHNSEGIYNIKHTINSLEKKAENLQYELLLLVDNEQDNKAYN